ncbi:ribosomal RNA processing protein 36 homolog isoform X2 [Physella acuta]|nr:ribosomal RNA processing protein 36 homolog isoform X2 [Physella acuta]XP_059173357.1 ribosomal RNA processing protein 36 homolog isoform X2 [Physella acuta]XP_059173358.1 ribosomal RNA processing protein 36 homolog isoform X2 [Physella acuta]XP_059173359.1 ribosomal RNA processing protein 36 homolog isoform X2 [Physella acuta]XP_059173360.1 ribosomal RNA processing protein 36 homolog isoform X2 [Physella acuta]XP_059173361.1 ribosomal RNA processing protein 36 homolog isoform X2 [Physella 
MDEDDTMDDIRKEMSNVPLNELKEIQEKLGLKAFNKIKHGMITKSATKSQKFKRENKNRPTELSARRPVPKTSFAGKNKLARDPRFDDLSGEFNEKIFKQTYGFLNDVKTKEKLKLKKMITKTTDKNKKSELKQLVNRMEQKELAEARKSQQELLEKEWTKKERERIKEGKKPFFLKKSAKKALWEAEFKKELEEKGKMQKYLTRKSKKLVSKERKTNTWTTKDV